MRDTRGEPWRAFRGATWTIRGGGMRFDQILRRISGGRSENRGKLVGSCVMVDVRIVYGSTTWKYRQEFGSEMALE